MQNFWTSRSAGAFGETYHCLALSREARLATRREEGPGDFPPLKKGGGGVKTNGKAEGEVFCFFLDYFQKKMLVFVVVLHEVSIFFRACVCFVFVVSSNPSFFCLCCMFLFVLLGFRLSFFVLFHVCFAFGFLLFSQSFLGFLLLLLDLP